MASVALRASDVTTRVHQAGAESLGTRLNRAVLTPTAWHREGDMPFRAWVHQGQRLGLLGRGAGWWIGDWLRYGNASYGEKYSRAGRITGYDAQTLMNMVYVASRYEFSRRRENLSWSHHAELASLDAPAQEEFLDRAERDRLSVRDLRELVRLARREGRDGDDEAGSGHEVLVCPECGHRFAAA